MQAAPQPPIVIVCGPLPAGEPVRVTRPAGRLTLTWDTRQISRAALLAAAERAASNRPHP
ncbi:hypothetical protein LIX60_25360 [Streptomyces sp. S07_1.15]|uniref:hypothetical protein n=1 Tax=Streptomyces sp. S07_1.15 TaxID=2873925 RepID=UPI001D14150E|nr:hypothetical protein [Streptomyces sp. S07_1.15]MCC3654732.1 hypothetical protein [Streptomyces sp. S07_1.15]